MPTAVTRALQRHAMRDSDPGPSRASDVARQALDLLVSSTTGQGQGPLRLTRIVVGASGFESVSGCLPSPMEAKGAVQGC
jgi:hypothetical protein